MPHTVRLRRRLIHEYGETPGAMMLIDRAVAAYQDFARISGWTGNTALMVEAEFFGRDRPILEFRDRHGMRPDGEVAPIPAVGRATAGLLGST
jgi:hypothetical protein